MPTYLPSYFQHTWSQAVRTVAGPRVVVPYSELDPALPSWEIWQLWQLGQTWATLATLPTLAKRLASTPAAAVRSCSDVHYPEHSPCTLPAYKQGPHLLYLSFLRALAARLRKLARSGRFRSFPMLRIMPAGHVPTVLERNVHEALQGPVLAKLGKPPGGASLTPACFVHLAWNNPRM
ncbi:hypothetical protein AOQ84DRAFT_192058 [Glonium stellatum]|uniref:Uncharacterized protein n=1 Tax=Glonium stellatum TaxID=574774 RepID=A0A8E2JW45_9PEZI|nr:hypothetical protein AOQ84DRAFT_192058 [Glonium stellatum]